MRNTAIAAFLCIALSSQALEAKTSHIADPLLDAIAEHESHYQANVVGGRDGQCVGLTQICLHGFEACKDSFEAPACLALKQRLLDPTENLRVASSELQAWRKLCKRVVGRADVRGIVFGFAGADGRGVHCGMRQTAGGRWVRAKTPRVVRDILVIYQRKLAKKAVSRKP